MSIVFHVNADRLVYIGESDDQTRTQPQYRLANFEILYILIVLRAGVFAAI